MENICVNCGESNRVALTQRTTGEWQYLCGACCGRLWQTIVPGSRKKQKRSKKKIHTVVCPDCGKERRVASNTMSMIRSGAHSGRCHFCANKKTNEERYRGHEPKQYQCVDCGTVIWPGSTRCYLCHIAHVQLEPNHCVDCGKEITCQATRCLSCRTKEMWNSGKLDHLRVPDILCEECGKPISRNARGNLCRSCWWKSLPRGPSDIEEATAIALRQLGLDFEAQFSPDGVRWIWDFRIGHVLVEVQGTYWHSTWEARRRDGAKAEWARRQGFFPIEIWGHEIRRYDSLQDGAEALLRERLLPLLRKECQKHLKDGQLFASSAPQRLL